MDTQYDQVRTLNNAVSYENQERPLPRHRGLNNALFFDGHTAAHTADALWWAIERPGQGP